MENVERESLDVDVLFVGAGPASLSGALHLAKLIQDYNGNNENKLGEITIAVIEKGREIGAHSLSGAVMDPRGLDELLPDWRDKEPPLEAPVSGDAIYYLTKSGKIKYPFVPPPLNNHGCYIVSLNKLVKWLGAMAEASGIDMMFPEFPGASLLYEGEKIVGVTTGDKGLDQAGERKSNFEPGVDIRAKVTVLGEGTRGSLTKGLVNKLGLQKSPNPQVYTVGVKEVWQLPEGTVHAGEVIHTMGYPLTKDCFGGAFIYGMENNLLSLGLITGLDYKDPFLDPHQKFQEWKSHPFIQSLLKEGKMVHYGAKTIPEGGYYSIPRGYADGVLIIGDAGGYVNPQRLKGIHLAIKTGILASETILESLIKDDFSAGRLRSFQAAVESSWVKEELYKVRNFHQAFDRGIFQGIIHAGMQYLTGGRGLIDPLKTEEGHKRMKKISDYHGRGDAKPGAFKFDSTLTFDKTTDVYASETKHEEDQPCHLVIKDMNHCNTICREEFGNPCQYFCPASVYEITEAEEGKPPVLTLNPSNCVHCKTCDIMDPYEVITWVPPEGGGGPNYNNM